MKFNFRLGSIPVTVHGSFLLVVACLGSMEGSLPALVRWMLVVFIGVLLHELGHALVGRSFGLTPRIDLIGFGGLTSWSASDARALGAGKRIAISLAGPFTGIAVGAAALAAAGLPPFAFFGDYAALSPLMHDVVFVNAWWGFANLLPILPMDGGNVLFQSLNWLTKGRGENPARVVSAIAAVLAGLAAFFFRGSLYGAALGGLFAVQNVQALRGSMLRERDAPLRAALRAGFDALEKGTPAESVRVARDVLARAADPSVRADATRLLAFGYLFAQEWPELLAVMESPESAAIGTEEMAKFEQAARELGPSGLGDRIAAVRERRRAPKP